VPNGVDTAPVDPLDERELEALGIRPPYVLHAGGATRRKNLDALAAAWRRLDADGTLVLCGPQHPARERLLADLPRAIYLGHLDHALTVRLMRSAEAVVVPSLYEGFGLPALEAMAVGTPVVAARRGALPEVCGGAAILVEPPAEGLAEGLAEALADGARLRELGPRRAAAFTWERAAAQTLAAYEEALA